MMTADLLDRALHGATPLMLLHELSGDAHRAVVAALAAALVRRDALELADALAGAPLAAAQAAASEPSAAVEAARAALARERSSVAGRISAFWSSKRRADPDDRDGAPDAEPPRVQALREGLAAAEAEAAPYDKAVAVFESQVAGLRAAPLPDPAVLATIAEALNGGHPR